MIISGLENNYYLAFNEIWISASGFTNTVNLLELVITNLTTGKTISPLELSPSPENIVEFNICIPVRYLFPVTDHINNNSLQLFKLEFKVKFEDTTIQSEVLVLEKYFIRGGRNKSVNSEWYLTDSENLVVGKWIDWPGIKLPGLAYKIQNNKLVKTLPENIFRMDRNRNCDYRILKFLNSLGGYQFFVFEKFVTKSKTKAGKIISKTPNRLRYDNFKTTSISIDRSIEFQTITPKEIQEVFTELISSPEVFLYNPDGNDEVSKWELLQLENNESEENNYTRKFENKAVFSFSNYYNKTI